MSPYPVVLGLSVSAVAGAYQYFRRWTMERPPIGVINRSDLITVMGFIIFIPYLYLWVPPWGAASLLGLGAFGILYALLEPILRSRTLLAVAVLIVAEVGSHGAVALNDVVLVLITIGLSNLWAQGGMKAVDAGILAAFLSIYDYLATTWMPMTGNLIDRLAGLPFSPALLWYSDGASLGIGLGDLFLCAVFPLVARKAFGAGAGLLAMAIAVGMLAVLMALPLTRVFPVMVVLGPLIVVQAVGWSRGRGERTMAEYRRWEAIRHKANSNPSEMA